MQYGMVDFLVIVFGMYQLLYFPLILMLGVLASFTKTGWFPAIPDVAGAMNLSPHLLQWFSTLYSVFFSFAIVFYTLFSNRFGRKIALHLGSFFFVLSTGLMVLQVNFTVWLLCAAFLGMALAPSSLVRRMMIEEIFEGRSRDEKLKHRTQSD